MQEFTNETLDTSSLPKYQEVQLNSLSRKYWNVILINIFLFLLFAGIGIAALLIFSTDARSYTLAILSIYGVIALLLVLLYRTSLKKEDLRLEKKTFFTPVGSLHYQPQ
ncbi:hypothetical protein [Pedobacter steynii]